MTSLRAQIEAKSRRSAMLPIAVGDVTAAAAAVNTAARRLDEHQARAGDPAHDTASTVAWEQRKTELQAEFEAAVAAATAAVVVVKLHSLPADEWDGMWGDLEPDEGGDLDISHIHAELLAASCDDPELQDADWWRTQFADTAKWSKGDRAGITNLLLQLNVYSPVGGSGKG